MKRALDLERLYAALNETEHGGRLPPARVHLRPEWRGPRFGLFLPGNVMLSGPWYAYHRARLDPAGVPYLVRMLLHEMAHAAAFYLLGDPTAGADHGASFRAAGGAAVGPHAPLAPGFLRSLPVAFRYVCPLCSAGWGLPYALSERERVCASCAPVHGPAAARVRLASKRAPKRRAP